MKLFVSIIILFSIGGNILAQSKATIGMTIKEVKKIYPGMEPATYQNTLTLSRNENLHGVDGRWGYRFEHEKLNWIYYDKYIDVINEKNFTKCLTGTRQIITDFTNIYGNPDSTITGNTKFIDPYKKHHLGYNVLEARWKNYHGMKIKVEFTFMGGKGVYNFLVKINYFDSSYPYFD